MAPWVEGRVDDLMRLLRLNNHCVLAVALLLCCSVALWRCRTSPRFCSDVCSSISCCPRPPPRRSMVALTLASSFCIALATPLSIVVTISKSKIKIHPLTPAAHQPAHNKARAYSPTLHVCPSHSTISCYLPTTADHPLPPFHPGSPPPPRTPQSYRQWQ